MYNLQPSKKYMQTCFSSSWGGLEMVAFELALSLIERGFDIIIAGYADSPLEKYCHQNNVPFYPLAASSNTFEKIVFVRNLLIKKNIDTIIIQKLPSLKYIVPAKLLVSQKIKIFAFSHIMININKKDFFHRFLYSHITKIFSMTDLQSKRLLEYLPVQAEQIEVIPNWISKDKIVTLQSPRMLYARKLVDSKAQFKAVMTSRLDPQKGQDLAIQAIYILKQQNIRADLFIVGENTKNEMDFKTYLETLSMSLGLQDQIHFLGYMENLSEIYNFADVLLVPSWEETFGRVIIEAMAVGLPSIASNAGGVPDIIHHMHNGLLFETKSAQALADMIKLFMNQPELRQQFKKQCLTDSSQYAQDAVLEKLIRLIA